VETHARDKLVNSSHPRHNLYNTKD
jgi:hypothetical protein